MIDISEILYDPDFNQDFTVYRKTGTWSAGRFAEAERQVIPFSGVVIPASAREVMQFPEGDRVVGMMKFYSDQVMFVTHTDDGSGNAGTSDEIVWRGERYRVLNVNQYGDYGCWIAYAVYMQGD